MMIPLNPIQIIRTAMGMFGIWAMEIAIARTLMPNVNGTAEIAVNALARVLLATIAVIRATIARTWTQHAGVWLDSPLLPLLLLL